MRAREAGRRDRMTSSLGNGVGLSRTAKAVALDERLQSKAVERCQVPVSELRIVFEFSAWSIQVPTAILCNKTIQIQ